MPKYFGSTNGIVDWDPIVKLCAECTTGDMNTVVTVVDRSEVEAEGSLLQSYRSVINTWQHAGYNLDDIVWHDYYPKHHFDIDVQNKFADLVNADPLRVFVSDIAPGRNVPYHWDVEDKEEEWLAQGQLKRWVCFIDKPRWGSVLILEDECFYNIEQGTIYEWNHYKSYHAGTACGTHHQYLFHFLGRPR
jgi:hypothetical protein